mmetsp:Transcript_82623/g.114219  ORF Transcript_82623/g.114219 Transcript_82623/m.114219 type:complete len:136 (+) Transcript_82623:542-949(+)
MKSYAMACGASISLALGVRKAMGPMTAGATGARLMVYNSVGSFIGCSTAGFLNAWFMRQTELKKGIDVLDPDTMESYGKSKSTAMQAVVQTATSRFVLAFALFIPSLMLLSIEKMRLMPKNFAMRSSIEMFTILC